MKYIRRFPRPRLLCAAALALPLLFPVGCLAQGRPAPVVVPAATTLAGVKYEPAAPLDAVYTPKFDAASPPTGPQASLNYSVRFKGANGETVPALFTVPASASKNSPVPCVLLLHGLGGSKETLALMNLALAQKGYASLSIDIAGHGERPKIGGKPVSDLSIAEMKQMAAQTVQDLRRTVDLARTRPEIDSERIAFLGVSLGGIFGGVFLGEEPRIKAGVLWAAGGDWGKIITQSQHAFAKKYRDGGNTDPAKIEEALREVDPARVIAKAAPRPLLMLHGEGDTIIPRACAEALFAGAKEPKKLTFLPGAHVPNVSVMLAQSLVFLEENLKSGKPAAKATAARTAK